MRSISRDGRRAETIYLAYSLAQDLLYEVLLTVVVLFSQNLEVGPSLVLVFGSLVAPSNVIVPFGLFTLRCLLVLRA
jgi:hypothetical protein